MPMLQQAATNMPPDPGSVVPGVSPNPGMQQPPSTGVPGAAIPPEAAPVPEAEQVETPVSEDSDLGQMKTKMEEATPEEQREYERASEALHEIMYGNDDLSDTIVKSLKGVDENKVDPIFKMGLLVIQQLDDAIDLDESVVAQITGEVAERLIEMAETRYKVSYSERETQQTMGALWEGVIALFDGADEREYNNFVSSIHPDDMKKAEKLHGEVLNG